MARRKALPRPGDMFPGARYVSHATDGSVRVDVTLDPYGAADWSRVVALLHVPPVAARGLARLPPLPWWRHVIAWLVAHFR